MKLCFATNNQHKLNEIREIVGERIEIVSLKDIGCNEDIPEDQETIEKNSYQKARFVFDKYKVNCFADDTGLEVEALKDAPGVRSARYAGEPPDDHRNVKLLLKNLSGITNRKARFKTVITLINDQEIHQFEGIVNGFIAESRKGSHGFGYDPVFIPDGSERTFAEMTLVEKNKISHRYKAVSRLAEFLKSL